MALIHTLIGNVKGPAGAAGQNFEYKKTYASVSAMNNDYSGTDTSVGDYVIIAANSLSDADNGKVYRKGNSSWVYVVQVAGPRGAQGDPGPLCPLVNNFNTTISGQGALDAALGPEIKTGDTQNNVVTFTSSDVQDSAATSWTSVTPLATGETHTSLMGKISQFAKNIRFLYKLLGTTDISGIGSGTVTDILSALNTNKFDKSHVLNNLTTPASQTGYALDAREGKVLNDNISSLNDALTSFALVDSRDMAADTARGVNSENGYGDVTLSKGFYLLISETSVQANFNGRTFARFKSNNANVMGNNTFVPPTINGYGYLQLVQFVNVTSSANVGRYYYDTVQSASSHLWRVYKLFG